MVYRRCARDFGWTPDQVDRLEVWQVGSALGVATKALEDWAESRNRPGSRPAGVESPKRDLVAERVAASKGEGPPVEPDAMPLGQVRLLQEAIRGG